MQLMIWRRKEQTDYHVTLQKYPQAVNCWFGFRKSCRIRICMMPLRYHSEFSLNTRWHSRCPLIICENAEKSKIVKFVSYIYFGYFIPSFDTIGTKYNHKDIIQIAIFRKMAWYDNSFHTKCVRMNPLNWTEMSITALQWIIEAMLDVIKRVKGVRYCTVDTILTALKPLLVVNTIASTWIYIYIYVYIYKVLHYHKHTVYMRFSS